MIIIGSIAMKYHFPHLKRESKDIDIIASKHNDLSLIKELYPNKKIEQLKNDILINRYPQSISNNVFYLTPNELYTLKISHTVGWPINWEKHVYDITFLKEQGCVLDKELFQQLYEYWKIIHGKNQRSKLDMTAEDFFDNALKCEYNHDDLHTLLNPTPTYFKVLKDGAEVEVSEDKFNQLSYEDKLELVREEVEVMAWERWPELDYRVAYSKMLKKFVINHAPIWEAVFILENHRQLHKPIINYKKQIEDNLYKIKNK